MKENPNHIKTLILKFLREELNETEQQELHGWLSRSEKYRGILRDIQDKERLRKDLSLFYHLDEEKKWAEISRRTGLQERAKIRKIGWWKYAAAVALLLISGGVLFQLTRQPGPAGEQQLATMVNDRLPGGDRAVLTLADGSTVLLDEAREGLLAEEGHAQVRKTGAGSLEYRLTTGNDPSLKGSVYNTLTTPRGGQFKLILPDGSKAWLNAASSIRYPTSFNGKERRVQITGEVYFEVAKQAGRRFLVETAGTEVEVLGTHFNVNAYEDESAVRTTLLEGSVLVRTSSQAEENSKSGEQRLRPGQQAQVKAGGIRVISGVNVQQAVAWKNGYFHFNDAGVREVMRPLARWYDVEVQYEGQIPDLEFSGKIQRDLNLKQVLKILEKSGIHFSIEGRKLVVKS